jgi:4-hydroxy-tetrahydrodipicolinate synthase
MERLLLQERAFVRQFRIVGADCQPASFCAIVCRMNQPLAGIFTPNITPLDARGRLDEDTLRGYVDWLIEKGVHGLYPNGSTGEFVRFTPEERRRVIEVVVDQTRGRVPILAGAAEANVSETIRACDTYGGLGCRAVAIVAPFYYRLAPDGVFAYFKEIADNVSVDVTLYNIPLFASPIDVATVKRLAQDCQRVVGIKDSSGDIPHMMRMISEIRPLRPDFFFMTGWDAALVPMLMVGCDGGTNATSGVVPELTRAIYEACKAGQWERGMQLQYRLLPLFDAMIATLEFPEGFRRGARIRGWDLGQSRQPLSPQQTTAAEQAQIKLQEMLSNFEFMQSGQLPPRTLAHDASDVLIDRIVSEVLSQLRTR